MKAERIKQLREFMKYELDTRYTAKFGECLTEIERLQTESRKFSDPMYWLGRAEDMKDIAEAAASPEPKLCPKPTCTHPLMNHACRTCAGPRKMSAGHCGHCATDADEPKQPEPVRCNATNFSEVLCAAVSCGREAGHDYFHVFTNGNFTRSWSDNMPGAKPHTPERAEPPMAAGPAEVNGRLVAELKAARELVADQEQEIAELGDKYTDAQADWQQATKERDEARAALKETASELGRLLHRVAHLLEIHAEVKP